MYNFIHFLLLLLECIRSHLNVILRLTNNKLLLLLLLLLLLNNSKQG